MPALSPLAIALQGIGFGTHLTALQGLVAVEEAATTARPLVISAAWLKRMRERREALRTRPPARDSKTRKQIEEEADELERFKAGVAALQMAAEQRAHAEIQAAEQAQAVIAQAQRQARRRRHQQELLLLLT